MLGHVNPPGAGQPGAARHDLGPTWAHQPNALVAMGEGGWAGERSSFSITRLPSNTSQKGEKGHLEPTHPLILKGSRSQGPEYSGEPRCEWGEMTFALQELLI